MIRHTDAQRVTEASAAVHHHVFILLLYTNTSKFFFGLRLGAYSCNLLTVIVPLGALFLLPFFSHQNLTGTSKEDRAFPRDSEQAENLNLISHQCIIR